VCCVAEVVVVVTVMEGRINRRREKRED